MACTKLLKLRQLMTANNVSAYIVPSEDAHFCEYVAECDKRRAFISGFTGSAGTALVTTDKAYLWTDGRYFLQAENQLTSEWTLMKAHTKDVPTIEEFLISSKLQSIGCDPTTMSMTYFVKLGKNLASSDAKLVSVDDNLVDCVWNGDRPARPLPEKMIFLSKAETGRTWLEKVSLIRDKMVSNSVKVVVLSLLDDLAWLFNYRGLKVIPYSPVCFAYGIITLDEVHLFIDVGEKFQEQLLRHLGDDCQLKIYSYGAFSDGLKKVLDSCTSGRVWLGPNCNASIGLLVPEKRQFIANSPAATLKAVKSVAEIKGMTQAHVLDAVALCEYLWWLENQPANSVTELSGSDYLDSLRSKMETFQDLSFESISGSGSHGAVIHYRVNEETDQFIGSEDVYLIDSGGHYTGGTTDVTRTVLMGGQPSTELKDHYSRVLKGFIGLSKTQFPEDIRGSRLDVIARHSLWQAGLEYHHGTGHGVGVFLNVHEGPCGISGARVNIHEMNLSAGMVVTIEPGFYLAGKYGIRIENTVVIEPTQKGFDNIQFLKFKPLTVVPIQTKMIDRSLLTQEEVDWLNDYHGNVRAVIGPELLRRQKQQVYDWLMRETEPI